MNKIEKRDDKAYWNREATITCLNHVQRSFLSLAFLLKENRDKKLYKLLDYLMFEDYLGSPEISISRAWAYDLIGVYELYIEKLQREEEELRDAKITKLLAIRSVVESNPDEWIGKCIALSKSDLKEEVRVAQGQSKGEFSPLSPPPSKAIPEPSDLFSYGEWVEQQECMVCGNKPVDKAHFPRTQKAGGELVVPLCQKCHIADFHHDPKEFMWKYRGLWERYFLKVITEYCLSNRMDKKESADE